MIVSDVSPKSLLHAILGKRQSVQLCCHAGCMLLDFVKFERRGPASDDQCPGNKGY